MRIALLALVLLIPLAAADPAETIRECTELGCVVAEDTDGDGEYDWINAAIVPSGLHLVGASANVNRTTVAWEISAGYEEIGEATGVELEEFHVLFVGGEASPEATSTYASLEEGNEELGTWEVLAAVTVAASTRACPDVDLVLP